MTSRAKIGLERFELAKKENSDEAGRWQAIAENLAHELGQALADIETLHDELRLERAKPVVIPADQQIEGAA